MQVIGKLINFEVFILLKILKEFVIYGVLQTYL